MSSWSVAAEPLPSNMQSVTQGTLSSDIVSYSSENADEMLVDAIPEPHLAVSNTERPSPILTSPNRARTRSSVVIRRRHTNPAATKILEEWVRTHSDHPYPSQDQKHDLCARTKLSMSQVSNWIICARKAHAPKRPGARMTEERQPQDMRSKAHHSVSTRDNAGVGGSSYVPSPSTAPYPFTHRALL